ncbi:hypothetical protein [Streptomyces sp. 2A115]|uniref:hypothetical protein n=1 Tax=Streptomyces sp. 2A115 TaxID=3457439 RepID=UPI003FCF9972
MRDTTAVVEFGLSREVTWEVTEGHYLHFGREYPFGIEFVFISGPQQGSVDELTGIFSRFFEPVSDEFLLAGTSKEGSVDERRMGLVRAGLGAPLTADARYLDTIVAAMHHEDSRVREGGLWAALYALWPEFLHDIEEMASGDQKPLLREQAQALAAHMREKGLIP